MDQKQISFVVLLDMSKAFDSVWHDLLLLKLRQLGMSNSAHAWYESYLSSRSQVVKLGLSCPTPPINRGSSPRVNSWPLYCSRYTLMNLSPSLRTVKRWDMWMTPRFFYHFQKKRFPTLQWGLNECFIFQEARIYSMISVYVWISFTIDWL